DLSEIINIWRVNSGLSMKESEAEFNILINKLIRQHKNLIQHSLITKAILSSINSIIYIKDINQKYLVANDAFIELLGLINGYRVDGKTDFDFYNSTEAKEIINQDNQVLSTGKPITNLNSFMPGTKKKRHALISKFPILDSENKIVGLIGTYNDITEMKKAGRVREILEIYVGAMTDCLSVFFSHNYKYIFVNNAYADIFGYPVEKFYEGGLIDFFAEKCVHPDDREQEKKYLKEKNWPKQRIYRIIKPNGDVRWLEGSVNRRKYFGKECCISVNRDITERVYESAFSDLFGLILEHSDDVLWIRDKTENEGLVFVSVSVRKLYGHSEDIFYKDSFFWLNKCLYSKDKTVWLLNEENSSLRDYKKEYRIYDSKQQLKWIELTCFEYKFLGKECYCYLEKNITDKKAVEKSKENESLRKVAKKLRKMDFNTDLISEITELSRKQIEVL
ncbi:MAG: PAS domain-containing protein, partial [Victivallales bacterium]|nr:PAS domain-containing protein [Victivallales bacterium]